MKAVIKAIGEEIPCDKTTFNKTMKVKRRIESSGDVLHAPYSLDQLAVLASKFKWHDFTRSMMMFLLTCGGRA